MEVFSKAALAKANPINKAASLALKKGPTSDCHSNMASTNAGTNSNPKCPYSKKPPSHHQAAKLNPINPNKRQPWRALPEFKNRAISSLKKVTHMSPKPKVKHTFHCHP